MLLVATGSSQDWFCTCCKTSGCLCVAGTTGHPTPASILSCASLLLLPALPDTEHGFCVLSGGGCLSVLQWWKQNSVRFVRHTLAEPARGLNLCQVLKIKRFKWLAASGERTFQTREVQ